MATRHGACARKVGWVAVNYDTDYDWILRGFYNLKAPTLYEMKDDSDIILVIDCFLGTIVELT